MHTLWCTPENTQSAYSGLQLVKSFVLCSCFKQSINLLPWKRAGREYVKTCQSCLGMCSLLARRKLCSFSVGVRTRRCVIYFSVSKVSTYEALHACRSSLHNHVCVWAWVSVLGTCMRCDGECVQVHPLGIRVWLGHIVWGLMLSQHDRSK